ncbi:MAG: hypothetical protein KIS67_15945 [Verrucomicrobiae bacterium]|nr:hypothetical protein [Verrucomicrobiae bacterium]
MNAEFDQGTNHSRQGLHRLTGKRPAVKFRLASLIITALVGSLVVIWVNRTTWERVAQLQSEFASLNADNFYLGVRMRGHIQQLNDTLLRYRLRGDTNDYLYFKHDAVQVGQWLEENRPRAASGLERDFFTHIRAAYDEYVIDSMAVLEANRARWASSQAREFQDSYKQVQKQSQNLLFLCDTFVKEQRAAFADFLKESRRTLYNFETLLKLSLILLLALAAALVTLGYRNMIAPLRHQLTESQAIIARQEKLASLGVLAAGVAHEIRNPLTAIKFRLFSLKKTLPNNGVENEDAGVIASEINRLERIVHEFLQFARPSDPALVAIPAHRMLEEVQTLMKAQLRKSAIELNLEPSPPAWVRADSQQIKQVLINLIQNAADSIGREGTITLRLRSDGSPTIGIDRNSVSIEVQDSGKGIPPEVQGRLFDPFFTTKEGGMGLGLPIAARIVEKHGGQLLYRTELNRGTTFSILLPHTDEHEG